VPGRGLFRNVRDVRHVRLKIAAKKRYLVLVFLNVSH